MSNWNRKRPIPSWRENLRLLLALQDDNRDAANSLLTVVIKAGHDEGVGGKEALIFKVLKR